MKGDKKMLNKSDCMSILIKLEDKGVDINAQMKKLILAKDIPIDVLKFIAEKQGLEAVNFYEMLRKSYNNKKSKLYKNILDDIKLEDVCVILSSLLLQIALYSSKLTDTKNSFLQEIRANEISEALADFYKSDNVEKCLAVLNAIKTDLLVLEYLNGRRELN